MAFVKPNEKQKTLFARSRDYVVVLHLTDGIKNLYLNDQLTDLAIQSLFRESNAKR